MLDQNKLYCQALCRYKQLKGSTYCTTLYSRVFQTKFHENRTQSDREINIKMDFQEVALGAWTGSSWLRIGTGGGSL
jgi:hypothetical protein